MTAPYFVHGLELVNVGGEPCSACDRPAVGRSLAGHLICATHAGWAAELAEELAREKEESKTRSESRFLQPSGVLNPLVITKRIRRKPSEHTITFACGHPRTASNTYTRGDGRRVCRECRRRQSTADKRKARERERRAPDTHDLRPFGHR